MKTSHKNIIRKFLLCLGCLPLLISFQNCSQQFELQQGISTGFDDSILAAPEITFTQEIPALISDSALTAHFNVSGSAMSISCQLNSGAMQDCSSNSVSYSNLVDGDYSLVITAAAANGMTTTQRRTFRKDSTAPVVAVSLAPAAVSGVNSASFVFMVTDNLSGVNLVECSLDNAAFATCVSPVNLLNLVSGNHNYRIRAQDRAGNMSAVYSYDWNINLVAPTVMLTSQPAAISNIVTANFVFSGSGVASYQCSLDNAAFAACASPMNYSALAAGAHSFRVQGVSAAGVVGAPVTYTWTIDNVLPTAPSLIANVGAISNLRTASFNFSSTDTGGIASYQCSLDNAAFAACTSPRALTGLADGNHNMRVQALDLAGNISGISAFSWSVDATMPVIAFTQTPLTSTTSTSASFAFSVTEANTASVQCSLDNAAFANCTSPVSFMNLTVAAHSFRVQARDTANNTSMMTFSWTVTAPAPVPTPTPTPSPQPTPGIGPTYYFSDCQTGAAAGCVAGNNANAGTSASSPKRDLSGMNLNTLPAGTSLLFARGGSWTLSGTMIIENLNVTPTAPLVFDAYGSGPAPLLRQTSLSTMFAFGEYGSTINDGGYTFRNLKLDGGGVGQWGFFLGNYLRNMTIENLEITRFFIGIHSQGVTFANIMNNNINTNSEHGILGEFTDSVIQGNLIENNNMDGGGFEHGIYLGGHADRLRVINNTFRRNSAPNGICTGGNLTVHGVYDDLLIEGNTIEQTAATGGCYGFSITAAYSYAESFTRVVIRNNTVINVGFCAVCMSSAPGAIIENNRIYNTQAQFQIAVQIPAINPGPGDAVDANQIVRNNLICYTAPGAGSEAVRAPASTTIQMNNYVTGAAATQGDCAR